MITLQEKPPLKSRRTGLTSKEAHSAIVVLNEKIVSAIRRFQATDDVEILAEIHDLCSPITGQVVDAMIKKFYLPRDQRDDLFQEAFIKLREAVKWNFKEERCPVFITFWRTCLSNHLKGLCYRVTTRSLTSADDVACPEVHVPRIVARLFVDHLEEKYLEYLESPLGVAILKHRILERDPDKRLSQREIADMFDTTQGYVSMWEKWILNKILEDDEEQKNGTSSQA